MDIVLNNKKEISGTHWIEFNTTGTLSHYNYYDDNSKYLNEYAYNFFTDIFEKVADTFNYYGETRFDKEKLLKLKQEIKNRIDTIGQLHTLEDIIILAEKTSNSLDLTHFIESTSDKQTSQHYKLVIDLEKLGQDLYEMIDNCIKQDKVLRILGI